MDIKITTEHLQNYKIFVGAPMYGGQCAGSFCKSTNDLSALCAKYGIDLKFYYLFNESLVQRARNYVADEFLRSECTHLMFIDADIGFKANDVLSMLGIQTLQPEKYDIMTGPYTKKTVAWEKVKTAVEMGMGDENPFDLEYYAGDYVFNMAPGVTSFKINEPVELTEAGTGFMLIPRETLEKYAEAYPELKYIPDHARTANFDGTNEITAFFDCEIDPDSRRYLSEDYFFCRNATKIGLKVHMCPWMELTHVGSFIFKGSLGAVSALGVTPTASKLSNRKNYKKKPKKAFRA